MSTPAIQVPVNPLPSGVNPSDYSPTPALDRLQTAFQQGLVNASDIASLVKQGSDTAKDVAVNAADVQAAQLRKSVQPQQAAADISTAQAQAATAAEIKALVPYKQSADIAAIHQAESEATLGATKAKAALPDAALTQKEMEFDPTGTKTALRDFYGQLLPGKTLPQSSNSPTGIDYDAIERTLYGNISGDQKGAATASQDKMDDFLHSMIVQRLNDRWFSTDQGKALTAEIDKKNANDLRYNADGTPKDFFTLQRDVAAAPARYNPEERDTAMADYTQVLKPQRDQLNEISKLVNTPGFIGRGVGSGDVVGKLSAEARAALGLGNIKYTGQKEIEMALNAQKQKIMSQVHNIRNLYEFNAVTGSIPSLDSTKEVWNQWLTRAQAQLDDAAKITKDHLPTEDIGDLQPSWTPPTEGAAGAAPASAGGPSLAPLVKTMGDYYSLPAGTAYRDAQGNHYIKGGAAQ